MSGKSSELSPADALLNQLMQDLNFLKDLKLGTDKRSLMEFERGFEQLQQAVIVASKALRCKESAEGLGDYGEAMYTVTNLFKEALLGADHSFLDFINGHIASASSELKGEAEQILAAEGCPETIPTPFDECFGAYADILIETNNFLEKYEEFFTPEKFGEFLEKFDKTRTTHEERVKVSKNLYPQLDSFLVKLTALSDRMIGLSQLFNKGNEDKLKSLNIETEGANTLAAAIKSLPVLKRVMEADNTIETFMKMAPKATGPWGKLNISQLHEIDTRLTILETRLCLIVVNAIVSNQK